MKSILLIAFLAMGAHAQQSPSQAPSPTVAIDGFQDCGLVTRFSPNKIKPECFQSIDNAILDEDYSILRRNGYAAYNATPCTGSMAVRGMWPFFATDGSQYLIVQSSGSMFSSKGDGLCTPITGLSGLSLTAQMSCVQTLGKLWCTDGTDPVFNTTVTTTNTVSGAPLGKYIGAYRNRVVISGVPTALTDVYLSGELDGTDYTLPTISYSTSPAILKINGVNDGLGVSCLMGQFQNNFYIGRNYDLWALSGYDLRDFVIRNVSDQIGCMDNNSHVEVNNVLMWLSHRGVEGLSGTQINWLSYPIDPTIRTIITSAGNSQGQVIDNSNFTSGNLSASGPGAPVSATISPGNLVPSSWSVTNNTGALWTANNTLINISTWDVSGQVNIIRSTFSIFNGDFGQGSLNNWSSTSWGFAANPPTAIGSSCGGSETTPGGYYAKVSAATGNLSAPFIDFSVLSSTGGALKTCRINWGCDGVGFLCSYASDTCDFNVGNAFFYLNTNALSDNSLAIRVVDRSGDTITSAYGPRSNRIGISAGALEDGFPGGQNFIQGCGTANYLSSGSVTGSFNTSFSTPTWGPLNVTISSGSENALTIPVSVSSDGITFNPSINATPGSKITNTERQYVKYVLNFTTTVSSKTATATNLSLSAATTGYYISQCITSVGNTSWGVLSVSAINNGGSFSFFMSTSAVSCAQAIAPGSTWNSVSANSIPAINVSSYSAVRVLFSMDSATQTPTLNSFTVNWNAGASRPPVASTEYRNRYFMFYTTSTAVGSVNDHVVILDQNNHWILYDDVFAASAANYLNQLYIGDSNATGTIYLFDTGSSDNGNSYNFSFTTPDLDGGDPVSPKQFKAAYMAIGAPNATTGNSNFNCNYTINGSTTNYSLGTVNLSEAPEASGYFVAKLPFPSSQPTTANWINLSCSNVGSNGPIRVYGIRLVYTPTAWP